MYHVDLILKARWILPVRPVHTVLQDHALIINDGIIVDIQPQTKVDQSYSAYKMRDLNEHILMPGLINAHTHLGMCYMKGMGDDKALNDWLNQYIWPVENKLISEPFIRASTRHALAECILSGITCVNDHYFHMPIVAEEVEKAGIKARLANCVFHFGTRWAPTPEHCYHQSLKLKNHIDNHTNRCFFAVGPHSPYGTNDQIMNRCLQLADKRYPVHIHMHETKDEIEQYTWRYQQRPLQRFYQKGWINQHTIAVHMVETNDKEIEILRQTQASVVHCPESNMKLASGIAPVNTMVANGVNVALGTDGHASNNDIDMFTEMRSASLLAKIDTHDPVSLPAEKAIEMATINGAQALHLNEKLGSLEIGKSADIIAVEANQLAMTPIYNPMSHLVYIANHANVSHVWVDGRCLLDNRVLTTFNVNQLHEEAFQWQRTIQTILAQVNSDQL